MKFRIPEQLETKQLVLRMFKEDDWRDLHEYYSDDACIKYTIGRVLTEAESWREIAIRTGHWFLRGYGPYAVEEKFSGKVAGIVGLWYPIEWPEPEITWHLSRSYWGKGFASEAARAVLKIASEYIPEISFISLIHPENIPSIKLAVALNARYEKALKFHGDNWCIYRHQRYEEK
ncbi:RimJ/RimL family protein N-acetyltransferase [Sporomusaceae bacterium BoRhaA]|uniref:GNAT family N-acetyltransferase n=1 Tax=Pelorhabdus rhamnosifermentans TaxID=2772457 RepID=UPI001C063DD2|nr:GNAT family N-acetyltransferase [Pelorhabdus rhamnosifermentans]MBU2704078.1 RimJ/RimL family protein N-acetyltransferase [Pelorhabdus rhamnosifermentans]